MQKLANVDMAILAAAGGLVLPLVLSVLIRLASGLALVGVLLAGSLLLWRPVVAGWRDFGVCLEASE
jgi:hypothetical protein